MPWTHTPVTSGAQIKAAALNELVAACKERGMYKYSDPSVDVGEKLGTVLADLRTTIELACGGWGWMETYDSSSPSWWMFTTGATNPYSSPKLKNIFEYTFGAGVTDWRDTCGAGVKVTAQQINDTQAVLRKFRWQWPYRTSIGTMGEATELTSVDEPTCADAIANLVTDFWGTNYSISEVAVNWHQTYPPLKFNGVYDRPGFQLHNYDLLGDQAATYLYEHVGSIGQKSKSGYGKTTMHYATRAIPCLLRMSNTAWPGSMSYDTAVTQGTLVATFNNQATGEIPYGLYDATLNYSYYQIALAPTSGQSKIYLMSIRDAGADDPADAGLCAMLGGGYTYAWEEWGGGSPPGLGYTDGVPAVIEYGAFGYPSD